MRLKFPRRLRRLFITPSALNPMSAPGYLKPQGHPKTSRGIGPASAPRLVEVAAFGRNPGSLRMLEYVPAKAGRAMPLVVVLHGCFQNALDFDRGSRWTALARKHGFSVLYPEQKRANNSNLCFNWFRPSMVARDRGKLGSIREMIESALTRHDIDSRRIFVMGLSAGGAMASALLATYPSLFAAGAIVGGLPFGSARDAMSALSVMSNAMQRHPQEWADFVRQVSPDARAFPAISIWHGTADRVVSFNNAEASLSQWLALHGYDETAGSGSRFDGGSRREWRDAKGRSMVELVALEDLGHGLPVKRQPANRPVGRSNTFMLPSVISTAESLVKSWKLDKR
jgi:poly(hydroxyalkanoate) depolymerase family esterase